jgi:hypothetical protein
MRDATHSDLREYFDAWRWIALAAILLAVLTATACAPPPRPPIVTPKPPPNARTVQATIRNAQNPSAQLLTDDGKRVECSMATLPDGVKRAVCALDQSTPEGWGAHFISTAPERDAQTIDFVLQIFSTEGPTQSLDDVILKPSFVALSRLVRAGIYWRLETGERYTDIETSEFNLLGRLANGEDVDAVLVQRSQAGYTTLRVFTAYDVPLIGRLWPKQHPELYSVLIPKLSQLAARRNLRIEFVGFTGPYASFFSTADQMVAHWDALVAAARDLTNVRLELVNEYNNPANVGIPIDRLQRPPPPIVASHGSAVQDDQPLFPLWDYATYHSSQPRKVVHNCWSDVADPNGIPCVINETARAPDNDGSLAHWQDIGRGCALLDAGCAFHSIHGKDSTLWTGTELTLALEFAKAARGVPLEFQDGFYIHRDDLEPGPAPCPCERVYEKRMNDGRGFIAPIRP